MIVVECINDEVLVEIVMANSLMDYNNFLILYTVVLVSPNSEIRCPCSKCGNLPYQNKVTITEHLLNYGFMDAYSVWWAHGEF
ncbi:hypothetical protein SLA2020_027450 [Shorea laevis]